METWTASGISDCASSSGRRTWSFHSALTKTRTSPSFRRLSSCYLTRGDFRLNPEHPPLIKEIAALPLLALDLAFPEGSLWERAEEWNLGRLFVHENRLPNDTILLTARLPMLLLSILLALALHRWCLDLFGPRAYLLRL